MPTFRIGDRVRIKSGAFASFDGKIEGINNSKRSLKIVVTIFGRTTPVVTNFAEAEKVSTPPPPPQSTWN